MKIDLINTSKHKPEKMVLKENIPFSPMSGNAPGRIKLDTTRKYQQFLGFGGAFTEAGAVTLDKLPRELRQEAIDAYFHPDRGINYSFCRTHINSCDFSLGNYSYVEANDVGLKSFSIDRDRKSLLPLIKDAIKTKGKNITLFASPWSPPPWMKTNGKMNEGGSLEKKYYETWARYFVKYIKAYRDEGVNIWGVTVQNEPQALTPWDNCIYSSEEERDFVKVLGPLFKTEGLEDVRIIVWDHNKDIMRERMDVMFGDEEAARWVWGAGFHWYGNSDEFNILDNSVLDYTYEQYGTNLVFTEGCNPLHGKKPFLTEWWTGEKYGENIINDLNHWTRAWCDWNMFLDEKGGPNHVGNYCDAPIIADTKENILHFNSPYYYIAHFSKYIQPGASRIGLEKNIDALETVAFANEDNSIALVVMNREEKDCKFEIELNAIHVEAEIERRSIQTYIFSFDD